MKKHKAAIVGCGRVASLFAEEKARKGIVTHAQAYKAHSKTELVAACDIDASRLEQFGRRWGVKNLYRDLDTMLRSERPDLLSICTWNTSHAALAQSALRHGVKGILCEKPIADSLGAADEMVREASRRKASLLVNYFRRNNPLHRKLKTLITAGVLGPVQSISCYYTAGLMNTGTHLFDTLRFFFGDVDWVWASGPAPSPAVADPTIDGYLRFKQGFGCTLTALDVKKYLQFEIDIYGSKKRLRISDVGLRAEFWDIIPHPMLAGYRTLKPGKVIQGDFSRDLLNTVDNLVACVEGRSDPNCSGDDGRRSLEIALALYKSLKSGRRVDLPLKDPTLKLESK